MQRIIEREIEIEKPLIAKRNLTVANNKLLVDGFACEVAVRRGRRRRELKAAEEESIPFFIVDYIP